MPKIEFEFVPFYHERLVGESSVDELRKSREEEGDGLLGFLFERNQKNIPDLSEEEETVRNPPSRVLSGEIGNDVVFLESLFLQVQLVGIFSNFIGQDYQRVLIYWSN